MRPEPTVSNEHSSGAPRPEAAPESEEPVGVQGTKETETQGTFVKKNLFFIEAGKSNIIQLWKPNSDDI